MKPLCTMIKGNVFGRMFPFHMKLYYNAYDPETDTDQKTMIDEVPCSVQSATATNGEVIDTSYIILSPCLNLDFEHVEGGMYEVEVNINGNINVASGTEIVSIDNKEVFRMDGVSVGAKMLVQLDGSRTWLW